MHRNKITILEDRVIKEFSTERNFQTELRGREIFSLAWKVPKILGITEKTITYEKIGKKTLAENIKQARLADVIRFIGRTKSITPYAEFETMDYSAITKKLPRSFTKKVRTKPERIVHGDFRPHNILEGEVLIDFEFSHIGVIEEDLAKFYVETLSLNENLADDILGYARKGDYCTFLFNCYAIGLKQLECEHYIKKDVKRFLMQVKLEIYKNIDKY